MQLYEVTCMRGKVGVSYVTTEPFNNNAICLSLDNSVKAQPRFLKPSRTTLFPLSFFYSFCLSVCLSVQSCRIKNDTHTCLFFTWASTAEVNATRATPQHCNQALFKQALGQGFPWHEHTLLSAWREPGLCAARAAACGASHIKTRPKLQNWCKQYLLTGSKLVSLQQ